MTNRPNNSVSNRDLYEAIGDLRKEFGGAITRLDDKFMQLEAGRLTALEKRMNDFVIQQAQRDAKYQEAQATLSTKFVLAGVIFLVVMTAIVDAVARKLIK